MTLLSPAGFPGHSGPAAHHTPQPPPSARCTPARRSVFGFWLGDWVLGWFLGFSLGLGWVGFAGWLGWVGWGGWLVGILDGVLIGWFDWPGLGLI